MAQFIPQSPFVAKLGIVADVLDADEVRLRLPWDPTNVTIADMVHGGAIAALADVAVMAAAWAGAEVPDSLRGVTTSMSMQFLARPRDRPDRDWPGTAARQDAGVLRHRRRHAGGRGGREGHRHLQGGLNGLATHLVKPAGGDVEDEPPQGFVFGDERACLDAAQ